MHVWMCMGLGEWMGERGLKVLHKHQFIYCLHFLLLSCFFERENILTVSKDIFHIFQ